MSAETPMMFDVPSVPKYAGKFTANAMKAINWYAENYGLKVELSTPPYRDIYHEVTW